MLIETCMQEHYLGHVFDYTMIAHRIHNVTSLPLGSSGD